MKTIIIHSENKNHLQNLLVELSNDFRKSDCKLFLHSKNYIPWSDDFIKNEIISYQEYYAYQTHKDAIDSVIELVLKSKTDEIVIIDENPNTNRYIGKRSDFLKSNLDTKYKSLDWFLLDVNTQVDNRGIPMYFFIPNYQNEDSQRYFKKVDSPIFNERIIYIDGGLGDHIMALPLLEKIQQQIYVCCKYPFIFDHLNLKGFVNWNDDLFGGYSRFVYEYGSSNNIETIIDAFFGLYGENREQTDRLVYNGSRDEDVDINVDNKKIALICTSAAKIQNLDSNKDWKDVRWMSLVHQLKKLGYFVIQVGTSKDNQIPNVNLKYLDKPIPKLAWLTDSSSLWISVDTFFHHFASAIKPYVGICLTPFYNDHAKHTGVTYIEKDCGKNYWDKRWWLDLQQPERKECMDLIQVEDVLNKVKDKKKVVTIYLPGDITANCSVWRVLQQYVGLDYFEIIIKERFDQNINEDLKSDLVIIIRPVLNCLDYIKKLRENGKKVLVDYDDALPLGPDTTDKNFIIHLNEIFQVLRNVDAVTVTTERLKFFYWCFCKEVPIYVLPNVVNPKYVNNSKTENGDKVILGWLGSSGHYENVKLIKDSVLKILNEFPNVYLNIYSNYPPIYDLLQHERTSYTPWNSNFDEFQNTISDIDINLAPFEETYINLHKSNIRIILPGYKGIPSVASNFGEYKDIGKDSVLLCETNEDWYENIKSLIVDKTKRDILSKNIQSQVESHFVFDKWVDKKIELLNKIIDN